MEKYQFNIRWSDDDREFVATCPEFPGLSAFGETQAEALAEGQIALGGMIETLKELGEPLPAPRVVETYSGSFRVRLPKSLHRQAAERAEDEGVSLNSLVMTAVQAKISERTGWVRIPVLAEPLADDSAIYQSKREAVEAAKARIVKQPIQHVK